jgi:hypothetical protein
MTERDETPNYDESFKGLFPCEHCKGDSVQFPGGTVYVEWSDSTTVGGNGCVGELFCSWTCAAKWFCARAGLKVVEPHG